MMFTVIFIVFALIIRLERASSQNFPSTLEGFGYAFNDAGQLRELNTKGELTDEPFKFNVKNDEDYNQLRYEALGELITDHIYELLEKMGLHRIPIPSKTDGFASFVFGTRPTFENTKKLLILIHGSGVVRAGQWSRSLIINQSLDHGTQIPYIKRAIEHGYDVLVTNTNYNTYKVNGTTTYIEGHETAEDHMKSVWKYLLQPVIDTIDKFAIVAHSYGGAVTHSLAVKQSDIFLKKNFAIACTDSVRFMRSLPTLLKTHFSEVAVNWVTSSKPLNTFLAFDNGMPERSAGHKKHEWTSYAAIDAVFPYIEELYEKAVKQNRPENTDL